MKDRIEHFGEGFDEKTEDSLAFVFKILRKFPELLKKKENRKFIGVTAVISTGLVVAAGIAIGRRRANGESDTKIEAEISGEEIENASRLEEDREE